MSRLAKRNVSREELFQRMFKGICFKGFREDIFEIIKNSDDYENIIEEYELELEPSELLYQSKIRKDLSKVDFSPENISFNSNEFFSSLTDINEYKIITLENGLTFCLCCAGGDWETPVYFIIYIDNENYLRAYIPSHGNTYDLKTKEAYRSDDDECSGENYGESTRFNHDEMMKDISERIKLS